MSSIKTPAKAKATATATPTSVIELSDRIIHPPINTITPSPKSGNNRIGLSSSNHSIASSYVSSLIEDLRMIENYEDNEDYDSDHHSINKNSRSSVARRLLPTRDDDSSCHSFTSFQSSSHHSVRSYVSITESGEQNPSQRKKKREKKNRHQTKHNINNNNNSNNNTIIDKMTFFVVSKLVSPSSNIVKSLPGMVRNISGSHFKLILLILMVLQNSTTVLVGRFTRTNLPNDQLYDVSHLILITELGKLLLSFIFEYMITASSMVHDNNNNITNDDDSNVKDISSKKSKSRLYMLQQLIQIHILDHPMDALKVSIPALLYLIQNTLLYTALSNLTAPIFQVTYQGKLITTALVSVLLLKSRYNIRQWICLFVLSVGVAIVVLGEQQSQHSSPPPPPLDSSSTSGNDGVKRSMIRKAMEIVADATKAPVAAVDHHNPPPDSDMHQQNLLVGLTAVTIACLSSAMAGVYFEMVLKKVNTTPVRSQNESGPLSSLQPAPLPQPQPPSLWMRNIQLSFFTIIIALLQGMTKPNAFASSTKSYLHGFTGWVWLLVLLQAGGGLLVAAVIKYADNVLKGLATGVSVVFATCCSMILFNTQITNQFIVGALLILLSVYFFSNPLPTLNNSNRSNMKTPIKGNLLPK